ncbi:MAG: M14 family zinc carboxypeptidase [Acidobacteriota bacterium]
MSLPLFDPRPLPRYVALAASLVLATAGSAGVERAAPAGPAEDPLPRPALAAADPDVPTPGAVLGHALGSAILTHREAVLYARRLADASPRVAFLPYGQSVEGRELFLLVVGTPARIADLDAIRAVNQRLTRPGEDGDGLVADDRTPATVWLAGSVHGDEHSSTEALLLAAYHLAADQSARTREWLTRVVVIVEPLQNPDGRQRFVAHETMARFGEPNPDPQAWEHNQSWPQGRGNHFFFDLNRDWFFQTQPETRARGDAFLAWRPQVFADLHEMSGDSTYYFAPPAEPVHPLVPESTRRWWSIFGGYLADAFDRRGAPFFRRETFDLFYPGYGDSWPTFQGAIGMTFEQASVRGLVRRRSDGVITPLAEAIGNHVTAALATVRCAADHRAELLADFRRRVIGTGRAPGAVRTVYLPPGSHGDTVDQIETLLIRQGVDVGRLSAPWRLTHPRGYRGEARAQVDLPAGTLVVRTDGAGGRLAAALFAMDATLPDAFLAEERRRLLAGERGRIYDVTAWAWPLVYDVEAWATDRPAPAHLIARPAPEPTALSPATAAYLLPPARLNWARAVSDLLEEGVRVRVSGRKLTRQGQELAAGTAVVLVGANDDGLLDAVAGSGRDAGVEWEAVDSFASEAGVDLGSDRVFPLKRMHVAVAVGPPVRATSFGAIADLFATRVGLPFTALHLTRLPKADLSRFDVLVLPDGDPKRYAQAVGEKGVKALEAFVETGGVLVAVSGAASFCGAEGVELSLTHAAKKAPAAGDEAATNATPVDKTVVTADTPETADERREALLKVPGAILRVRLATADPLAYGQGSEIPVPVSGDLVLDISDEAPRSVRVIGRFVDQDRLRMAGVVWPEARDRLAGTPWLVREKHGRGTIVLFASDPVFRGAWDGLRALFTQVVLVEPARL